MQHFNGNSHLLMLASFNIQNATNNKTDANFFKDISNHKIINFEI